MIVILSLEKDKRPEIYNLLSLMAAATNVSIETAYNQYKVELMIIVNSRISQ